MEPSKKTWWMLAVGLACTPALFWTVLAGDLEPAGPPGPTMKTLDQIEPRIPLSEETTPGDADHVYVISEPGSYYLTADFFAPANGIKIDSSNVTLDLGGFEITGGNGNGVNEGFFLENVVIRNGTISGFTSYGIFMGNTYHVVVDLVRVYDNNIGMSVGRRSIVSRSTARGNNNHGIGAPIGAIVERSVADSNGVGIDVSSGSIVRDCIVQYNGDGGVKVGGGSVVERVTVKNNTLFGIRAEAGSRVIDCAAYENTGVGISIVGAGFASGNSCRGNRDPASRAGSGISVSGADSRIDGNNVTDNDRGIDVKDPGNVIVRNSARSNDTDYVIVAGNDIGPIGTAAASTSPWANIQF